MLAAAPLTGAPLRFVDVGPDRGIQSYSMAPGMTGGVAAADFDDDGDIDLFVPNREGAPDQLYRNLGHGQFEEIAAEVGLASLQRSRVALWLDFDGDHLLDLFVAGDCFLATPDCPDVSTLKLYRQTGDGCFADVTLEAGLTDDLIVHSGQHRGGVCAGDVNNDGYLDLVTGVWGGEARLWLNNGDGTFTDFSAASGLGGVNEGHWQPVMHDFDGDGALDIFAAIDFTANHLWINQNDATFVDAAPAAGVDSDWNEMGVVVADYDNDGDLDVYITEIADNERHNLLYRNDSQDGSLQFTDVAVAAGVDDTGFGWGTTFLDADNDGLLDLAVTNGYFNSPAIDDQSKFFLNAGGDPTTFTDVSSEVGFDDTLWGSSLIALDFDRDGDLDLVQTCAQGGPLRLLENQRSIEAAANNFLVIQPRMAGPNHRAIGAVVRVNAGGLTMTRLISAGTSLMGQEPAEAVFGLGTASAADTVTIKWPNGSETELHDVAANQVLTVELVDCDVPADLDCDGRVGITDFLALLAAWGDCPPDDECPADLDDDGRVGITDLLLLLAGWG